MTPLAWAALFVLGLGMAAVVLTRLPPRKALAAVVLAAAGGLGPRARPAAGGPGRRDRPRPLAQRALGADPGRELGGREPAVCG